MKEFGIYSRQNGMFKLVLEVNDEYVSGITCLDRELNINSNQDINNWLWSHLNYYRTFSFCFKIDLNSINQEFEDYFYLGEIKEELRQKLKEQFNKNYKK